MSPSEQIYLLVENLTLGVALLEAVERGIMTARLVSSQSEFIASDLTVAKPMIPLEVTDNSDLIRRGNNQVRAAFACSIIETDRIMRSVCGDIPDSNCSTELETAHCIISLIAEAFRNGLMTPIWRCPNNYRKLFAVDSANFMLDTSELDGKELCWSDFGGIQRYVDLLQYCATVIPYSHIHNSSITPEQLKYDIVAKPKEAPTFQMAPKDALGDFVENTCIVGAEKMVMAKDLYSSYLEWCVEYGYQPVGQRSFGMKLTSAGFERRRRGRGRHWWVGIAVSEGSLVMA